MQTKQASGIKAAVGITVAAFTLGLIALRADTWAQAGDPQANSVAGVLLEVGLSLSNESTSAGFALTNQSDQPFKTTPIVTNHNRLVIVGPDGKTHERFSWKDGIAEVVVAPRATQTWKLDLAKMPEFKEPGVYRIRWKIGELQSSEVVVVREAGAGE